MPRIFYVSLRVGQREFIGQGPTRQAARHNAAAKALKVRDRGGGVRFPMCAVRDGAKIEHGHNISLSSFALERDRFPSWGSSDPREEVIRRILVVLYGVWVF